MRLQHKIKSYFKKFGFHLWKDLDIGNGFCFEVIDQESLLEIASRLRDMEESGSIEDKRFRMKQKTAVRFSSLDELLPWLSKILIADFAETSNESKANSWEFKYILKPHPTSAKSMCLVNALTSLKKENSHCVYTLVSIRKHDKEFYCWTF
ncbi:hypothetical protein HUK80_11950 [Flavobacterium sp. MAH-1]|uniref:Uncharacterized protein n=1 Tax=Flavobacterium agri TaxID=2743471 RepID=A0A7Y8Y4C3_9FLAO|nr:hypothetical protein [Flavobacterium agri]NUY81614.1 hypothetical protein [Flavobacterium agri]NYA71638.1 hypothetical protein [Flavobacterium agri]